MNIKIHVVKLAPFAGMCIVLLGSHGCRTEPTSVKAPKIPEVTISQPLAQGMPDFEVAGEIQAIDSVEVRARVGGVLKLADLKEGAKVKKGTLLFQIDAEPFELDVSRAKGDLERTQKDQAFAEAEARRSKTLLSTKSISQSDFDKAMATQGIKEADVAVADANLKNTELRLRYTRVTAPIDGIVGRKLVTEGNLISASADKGTLLTTIVYIEKVYAVFYVDERTAQLHRSQHRLQREKKTPIKVLLGLNTDGDRFPHQGTVDFVDNQVDPSTGTFLVRAIFDNPNYTLMPGYTARLRLYVGDLKPDIVISERALLSDKGRDFVYVMNDQKVVDRRFVRLGKKAGELVAVDEGLTKDDWIVTYGLQRLRPGLTVNPERLPMPGTAEMKK